MVHAEGGSISVWGMFSWHSLGSLIIVEGVMDQYKYASALADHVYSNWHIVFPQSDDNYQQDNAKCHRAGKLVWLNCLTVQSKICGTISIR
ncbi:transposable element Tcb1 transposase [Trichonephila inaurata madagascariensis]|uniref:Transposable element Tcb1 transposase n=1 Tax=Trichonephila inaurata madagascariensis TaxID=2747483 RepID=A0A8X6XLQ0_9ARAC|nr:transposable element Tcb1 transposase [Trichonephila inaurata madagascariensis]